ncbi:hypothetical protein JG687_00005301 [Phytophthora cactorum]|uniref:DUF7726 domain-containing protein n=1 Tax=Phytophthora cactorum TaxID=29920 RepID=A0A8T1ULB4_9STRA|nr:hypothetical protein JG687_00005301 [Phytophthora cactorum]
MTQTAFLDLLDIELKEFRGFIRLIGSTAGEDSSAYIGGFIFFDRYEKREKEKLKVMTPKDSKRKAEGQKEVKAKRSNDGAELLKRIEVVELPDMDDDGTVAVFDDCDEIRRKIIVSWEKGWRGANSGASNVVYRTAYVFFEKNVFLEGEEKTVKRLANEDFQGPGGFPLDHSPNWHFIDKVY